jgi:glycosyltransferase involved in cell wall biosynthesis
MRSVFARAAVAVCPLVYGAGIQNKVLEALASGVPTVMSESAAEAFSGTRGRDYLVCHDDGAFADAVLRLLADEPWRREVGLEGRRYVTEHHQWRALATGVIAAYEEARGEWTSGGGQPLRR